MIFRYLLLAAFTALIACQSTPQKQFAVPAADTLLLDHKYFEVHYIPDRKIAKYVKYTLTAANLRSRSAVRKNRFFLDPFLKARKIPGVAANGYARTGYQRGHLAPAEDFRFHQDAIDATFVMSNMAPQKGSLNGGPWKKLEEKVRRYACGEEKITVITGPVLKDDLIQLPSGVPVPEQFFKVVIDETPPQKALAYLMHQDDRGDVVDERVVSFDVLKEKTKEDFISGLPNADHLRQPAQVNAWKEADCR